MHDIHDSVKSLNKILTPLTIPSILSLFHQILSLLQSLSLFTVGHPSLNHSQSNSSLNHPVSNRSPLPVPMAFLEAKPKNFLLGLENFRSYNRDPLSISNYMVHGYICIQTHHKPNQSNPLDYITKFKTS